MIKLKNKAEILVDLSVAGDQTAAVNKRCFIVPFACKLKAIYAKLGTAGVTGTQTIDINKNGTTIWNGSGKLGFATTATAATYDALAATPTSFAKGDVITVDVDAVHSGTAAKNLCLLLVLSKTHQTSLLTDTVDGEV